MHWQYVTKVKYIIFFFQCFRINHLEQHFGTKNRRTIINKMNKHCRLLETVGYICSLDNSGKTVLELLVFHFFSCKNKRIIFSVRFCSKRKIFNLETNTKYVIREKIITFFVLLSLFIVSQQNKVNKFTKKCCSTLSLFVALLFVPWCNKFPNKVFFETYNNPDVCNVLYWYNAKQFFNGEKNKTFQFIVLFLLFSETTSLRNVVSNRYDKV